MSDVVAFLLLYIEEEECFWLLRELLLSEKYNMQGFFTPSFSGLNKGFYILNQIIKIKLPKLAEHFVLFF